MPASTANTRSMGQGAAIAKVTAEDYLAWEAKEATRHEFVRGEVFAMAGASEAHVTVAGNVYVALRQHLAGTPCRTFIVDMKLHVRAADAYYYPDVMVTCSAADAADPLIKREPVLLVEAPSSSTAAHDRGDKFAAYRRLPSLREYLVVDPDTRRSDLYRLGAEGLWVLHPFESDEAVQLTSVDAVIQSAQLWAELDPPATAKPA
jgi:Uma2 family endonuclease